jgi:hypothetical protein
LELENEHFKKELAEESQRSQKLLEELIEFKKSREQYVDSALEIGLESEKFKTALAEKTSEQYKLQISKLEKQLAKLKKKASPNHADNPVQSLLEYLNNLEKK